MVSILPVLDKVNLDLLNTDCMLENPLLSDAEQCACFEIKYPREIDLEFAALPQHLTKPGIHDVYILKNTTHLDKDMTISDFVNFPARFGGYPLSCHQISGENVQIFYDEFFQKKKMAEALGRDQWTFSWLARCIVCVVVEVLLLCREECPDNTNPLTLHDMIPPLQPPLNLTANATFTLSTKWGGFTHYMVLCWLDSIGRDSLTTGLVQLSENNGQLLNNRGLNSWPQRERSSTTLLFHDL